MSTISGGPENSRVRGAGIATREAEREANLRITQARKQQQDAVTEGEIEVESIKDEYVARTEAESVRQENTYTAQKNKASDQVRDLKRTQEAELARVRREGDLELQRMKSYYGDTIYSTERSGDSKMRELLQQQHLNQEFVRKDGGEDLSASEKAQLEKMAQLTERKNTELEELVETNRVDIQAKREESAVRSNQATEHFQKNYDARREQHATDLNEVNGKASAELKTVRQDTAAKLGAYAARQGDPFYRMMTVGAELVEQETAYVLTATIPSHEREHVTATVRGNQLVLSGQRRNEEKLEIAPGRTQSTNAFQTFSESFPLALPVDARQLRKEFDGDTLVVTVPKKAIGPRQPYQKKQVARITAERPDFPANLPVPAEGPTGPTGKTKGSGTLA